MSNKLIDWNKPLRMVDGNCAFLQHVYVEDNSNFKHCIIFKTHIGTAISIWVNDLGKESGEVVVENVVEPEKELWLNIYEYCHVQGYPSLDQANAKPQYVGRIACVKVTYRPGDGLE